MFQKLVSHNNDLKKLVERKYAVAFDSEHLVIRDIPYLDSNKELQIGAFVVKLEFVDEVTVKQDDHQVFFAGSIPHEIDGTPIANLASSRKASVPLSALSSDIVVERRFSHKIKGTSGYDDFYEKIETYTAVISGPAMALHKEANPYTCRIKEESIKDPIFKLHDTLTSRAELQELSRAFETEKVAIIGLGGTGSYILEFLAKTRIGEIIAFDADKFHVHNLYRSPGKVEVSEFGKSKTDVYKSRYKNLRSGLTFHDKFLDDDSVTDLDGITFAFVCVDDGPARASIFEVLENLKISFIDVGMGLSKKENGLRGAIQTTYYPTDSYEQMLKKGFAQLSDKPENLYKENIQISELNALNAALAVIHYKQLKGFYDNKTTGAHFHFDVSDLQILSH